MKTENRKRKTKAKIVGK